MSLLSYLYEDRCNSYNICADDDISFCTRNMPITKKIIKINKEKYEELKKEFSTIFDLYISDNDYYVIGTVEELRAVGIDGNVPFV